MYVALYIKKLGVMYQIINMNHTDQALLSKFLKKDLQKEHAWWKVSTLTDKTNSYQVYT